MKGARFNLILAAIIIVTIILSCLIINASATSSTRAGADVNDNAESYIYLEALDPSQEVLPSATIFFEIIARNLGDEEITYYPPQANSFQLPSGWTITFSEDTGFIIPANKYRVMFVNLSAPADANANTVVSLEIIGTTSNPNAAIIPASLSAQVPQIYDTRLFAVDNVSFFAPTEQKNVLITIENHGNTDDRIAIEILGIPTGLSISEEAKEYIISSGKTEYLTITLFPSSLLTAGDYELNISLYRINLEDKEWVCSHMLLLEIQYYPDLYLSYADIELSKYYPKSGEQVKINITIHNKGDTDARNFTLNITPKTKPGSEFTSIRQQVDFIGFGKSKTVQVNWQPESPAIKWLIIEIDPENTIGELNKTNNRAEYPINILSSAKHPPKGNNPLVGNYSIYQVSAVAIIGLIGGIAVASVLSTEYGRFALFKLVLPFYTRVRKEEVLNHELRELVYDYVQSHPGDHFRQILTQLGLTNGTLIHHLHTLENQNYIKSERDGPFKRFYPRGRNLTEDVLEINGLQMKILDTVKNNPGVTQKELAMLLKTNPPTINYHVKALNMVRLLNLKRDGKNTRCYPGQSLNGWVRSGVA